MDITRVIGTTLATSLLLVGGAIAQSEPVKPFKIGVILSMSGSQAIFGSYARRGIEMAIAARGGKVAGRPIEVQWEDDESKAQVGVQKATRLLASGLDTLFGPPVSGGALAVMPLAADAKVPHIISIAADDRITGSSKTRYTFRTSPPLGQETIVVARELKESGTKSVYGIAADVGVLRDGWKQVRNELTAAKIGIAGEDFPPFGNKDWSVIINKVAASGADSVAFFSAGGDAITFMKQAFEVGLTKKVKIIGPVMLDDAVAQATGPGAEGVQSVVRYHADVDTPESKTFAAAFKAKYNQVPDFTAGEAYDGITWWLNVVEQVGGTDREKWIDAFENSTFAKSLKGTKVMRACDHQAEQIAILAVGVQAGNNYATKIVKQFPAEGLFPPCK